ncbi:MAG: hypothetical protein V6Z86_04165 [Hyphomicrobiales bacterium]
MSMVIRSGGADFQTDDIGQFGDSFADMRDVADAIVLEPENFQTGDAARVCRAWRRYCP